MKRLILGFFFLSNISFAAELRSPDKVVIEKYLSNKEVTLLGEENNYARAFLYGNISKQSSSDLALMYVLEGLGGGNNYDYFLAIFKRVNGKLILQVEEEVGGKLSRHLSLEKFQDGIIRLSTETTYPVDGGCCKAKGETSYSISNKKLRER